MTHLVFGATSMVGELICSHLREQGERAISASRRHGVDLTKAESLTSLQPADTIICAAHVNLMAPALHHILKSCRPRRVVIFSSTSVFTKTDSSEEFDRLAATHLANAEQSIIEKCQAGNVEWTILRPTLVYREGRDNNVTQIARLVEQFGFMPLYGAASGMRQPVNAQDMALGAVAAARSPAAANKAYNTSGLETISYREMAGRVFDGLSRKRRLVSLPPVLWRSAFTLVKPIYPTVTAAMGERMMKNMAFDSSAAVRDFGWTARPFAPSFRAKARA
jgi:nucleoside-diphosphate-sugar epimerase